MPACPRNLFPRMFHPPSVERPDSAQSPRRPHPHQEKKGFRSSRRAPGEVDRSEIVQLVRSRFSSAHPQGPRAYANRSCRHDSLGQRLRRESHHRPSRIRTDPSPTRDCASSCWFVPTEDLSQGDSPSLRRNGFRRRGVRLPRLRRHRPMIAAANDLGWLDSKSCCVTRSRARRGGAWVSSSEAPL